ncbi:conserved hypothetical protein [Planktothrix serta PCC 8927]|uniref:DUF2281 domain-containing protein n=1 Tax=Planktothrix serta PCC 8927 TaxID=671068 RepID=A0A7Z9C4J8_9CYAN|nr:hypothetical protein [Planktothrix serta]VXD25705.1 conserved hypothetical protein [Planktothrix serta PCC 8927]
MTALINSEQTIVELVKTLNPQQQQQVIDFIEFLHFQAQKPEKIVEQPEEKEAISAYEVAKQWLGSVESGIGDLSYNKKYLQGVSKA